MDDQLNCSHSILSHARFGHAKGERRWVMASRTTVAPRGFNFNFILPERVISESFGHPLALSCAAHLLVRLGIAGSDRVAKLATIHSAEG